MSCPFRPSSNSREKTSFWKKLKNNFFHLFKTEKSLLNYSKLQYILNSIVESIITIDSSGIIVDFNKSAEKMFGYKKEEILRQNINILIPSPYKEEHDQFIRNYLTTGVGHIIGIGREVSAQKKDGTIFPVHLSVSEVTTNHDRYFTGVIRDITAERLAEKAKEAQTRIEAIIKAREIEVQAKNSFLHTISHELRTPLHAILGFTECLNEGIDGPLLEAQKVSVQNIYNASQHLLDIVNDMLQFAKDTATFYSKTIETCPISEILTKCLEVVSPLIKKKHLELHKKIQQGITLESNTQHLREIFFNLLSNAIKFTEKGSITVELLSSQDHIILTVIDTGSGINENDIKNLFIPFYTANKGTPKEHTGLGLPIVKHLIELHGGTIKIDSKIGVGSTFTVDLPLLFDSKSKN